jgi:hypothetical protein
MLPSTIARLILVSIVDRVRLGIDADGFMLWLSVARLGLTEMDVDPPVLTHADFVGNVEGRMPGPCNVCTVSTNVGRPTFGIGCGRYFWALQILAECIVNDLILVQFVREIVDPVKIVLIGCDRLATCREHFHHST